MARSERKGISVKGITARRLKLLCERMGKSVAGYCDELVNKKLDALGFRSFDKPLTLWEARKGQTHHLVAARDETEALGYATNVMGGKPNDIEVTLSEEKHDPKNLIPGVLVPDERRTALAG